MNILIFNWKDLRHSWAGGGESYVFEQATRWTKMGHSVTVFCGEDIEKKNLPAYEEIDGIKIYRKGGRYSLYFWAAWYYLTRFRGKMDVAIDVENGIPFFTPLFCRITKICFVHHIHAKQFFYELPYLLAILGYAVEHYVFPIIYRNIPIIAVSKTTKKELVKIGFKEEKIEIVYNGLCKDPIVAKNLSKKFSAPTILYLGRIKKYKRVDLLIKILPKIIKQSPNARMVIAGWGTEASNVVDLAMKSPLRRKITVMGPVSEEEKKTLLSKSWVFVNPSIGEGWSIAVIESNLYGTPAVGFSVAGLSESIQQKKTGLLAKDEEELTQMICRILKNNILRKKLSKNAMEWAKEFDWDKSAKKSLEIINRARRKN